MKQRFLLGCLLAMVCLGVAAPAYAQRTRPSEAQASAEPSVQQRKAPSPSTSLSGYGAEASQGKEHAAADMISAFEQQRPSSPPKPLRFWEEILPFLIGIFAFWLVMLILALTLTNAAAALIFLYIAGIMAPVALVCVLGIILALTQISTRSERQAKRARNPFWRFRGN